MIIITDHNPSCGLEIDRKWQTAMPNRHQTI